MSLGISKMVVTAMQRLVVKITPSEPAPSGYEIRLERETGGAVTTEEFEGLLYRSSQLYAPENYGLQLTALFDDPEQNQIFEQPLPVSIDPQESMATMLRQAVWDILFDAEIELDARPLFLIHDGFFRPSVLRKSLVPDMPLPSMEIGMPSLRSTAFQSNVREREEWRIPLRMLDDLDPNNPDDFGRAWRLIEIVKKAVNHTDNLHLGGHGVLDKAWSWRVMEDPDKERDRMGGLKAWLTVYVERLI